MVEMHLTAVRVELPTNNPVVLLQEVGGARRTLPIFIGAPEATAIACALQGVATSSPLCRRTSRALRADWREIPASSSCLMTFSSTRSRYEYSRCVPLPLALLIDACTRSVRVQ